MTTTVAEYFTEGHRLDFIAPASRNGAVATTGWLSMRDYHKAVAIYNGGLLAAATAVDFELRQATDDVGTGNKAITGKALTTMGNADDNVGSAIELDASELDVDGGFDYINLILSCGGGAASLTSGILIRYQPRFKGVDDSNLNEIVT